ncbi:MerR family transcriptional regulator [Bacillus shivajii]|uniref:MerR family transcriptional regulator n=1 Tax=Bacillus shivajii TaxID=1983719 RepID=UPI001CFB0426|nr:MerR family transcriptional regulator [Bacillus shivajii]UCZ54823.1 MerR family transcriptional regulator [Bacillus shivajii]
MAKVWKTKEVAAEFQVNQTTIQRWIKHFNIECQLNEVGHYVIDENSYNKLSYIHQEVKKGKRLKQIQLTKEEIVIEKKEKMVPASTLDERFHKMLLQIDQLDKKLQEKADEVVEVQMLQHRKEIDDVGTVLEKLDERINYLESVISEKENKIVSLEEKMNIRKNKKRRFAEIFSF